MGLGWGDFVRFGERVWHGVRISVGSVVHICDDGVVAYRACTNGVEEGQDGVIQLIVQCRRRLVRFDRLLLKQIQNRRGLFGRIDLSKMGESSYARWCGLAV